MSTILNIRSISNARWKDRAQLGKKEAIMRLKAQAQVTAERSHSHPRVLDIWAASSQRTVIGQLTSKIVMVTSATISQQVPYRLILSRFMAY